MAGENELPDHAYRGLRRVGELTDQEWGNLKQLLRDVEQATSDEVGRRDVLKTVAALGVGTVAGGITAQELVEVVEAAASTTDSDGNVGTPSNPVDVFADGVDSASVNTDETTNKNYVEPQVTASEGTSYTADLSQANYHKVTLTGDVSFDFSNVDSADTNSVVLHLVQDGTGGRTPSFNITVVWDSGSAPSFSTSANAEDVVTLVHDQDGGQWLGFVGGLGMA